MRLNSFKFIGTIYILIQVIPILDTVSKTFQKGSVTFSHIAPNLAYAKMKLQEEALSQRSSTKWASCWPKGRRTSDKPRHHTYADALVQHLDERFQNSLPLFSHLTVFDPLLLPLPDSVAFLEEGKDKIQEIAKIYAPEKVAEVVAEFELFKFHMARFDIPAPA